MMKLQKWDLCVWICCFSRSSSSSGILWHSYHSIYCVWWTQRSLTNTNNCTSLYYYDRMSSDSGFEPKYMWCWLLGRSPLTVWIPGLKISCQMETESWVPVLRMKTTVERFRTGSWFRYSRSSKLAFLNILLKEQIRLMEFYGLLVRDELVLKKSDHLHLSCSS